MVRTAHRWLKRPSLGLDLLFQMTPALVFLAWIQYVAWLKWWI
jgi:hypothetical protein